MAKRVITFGEIMMRLNPIGYLRLVQSDRFEATYAGGEANVAVSLANYGLERGLNDVNCATSYDDVKAYTPAWAEQITGVSRSQIIRIAREFADNADKTHGRSMIIVRRVT